MTSLPTTIAEVLSKFNNRWFYKGRWNERIGHAKYERFAEATEEFDYGCDFKDGVCVAYRQQRSFLAVHPACCCRNCAMEWGYIPHCRPKDFNRVVELFDKVLGFWRPGVGCILPRKNRSYTCLRYMCNATDKQQQQRKMNLLLEGLWILGKGKK